MALGISNSVYGDSSLAIGKYNSVPGGDYEWEGGGTSLVVGIGNHAGGDSSLIVGMYNYLPRRFTMGDNVDMSSVTLLGHGLVSIWPRCLIAGQYNSYDVSLMPMGVTPLLLVGMGGDSLNRSNAFEVYNNGVIRMVPQGDISMGEFGN